jgi:hypothetical protein
VVEGEAAEETGSVFAQGEEAGSAFAGVQAEETGSAFAEAVIG